MSKPAASEEREEQSDCLCLVLDLDHTLFECISFDPPPPTQSLQSLVAMRISLSQSRSDIFWFQQFGKIYCVKLRPFVRSFLQQASFMFRLYVFTNGSRAYAKRLVHLLDPTGNIFGNRIICREDSTPPDYHKDLCLIPFAASQVVIVDDTPSAWPKDAKNLIVIEKYRFFGDVARSYKNESASGGPLAKLLDFLCRIHEAFFDGGMEVDARISAEKSSDCSTPKKDVVQIMQSLESRLSGSRCRLAASGLNRNEFIVTLQAALLKILECIT
ncbi:hypothetical protein KP509_20G034100 [Ceratopteris richardii]|uniref:protein-serine/threonine phosphatase n=1 Tax=Ceratopteris richardii TaxID=49495 RepID=A0A8T2SF17_CERRI|nr:hypothetical protein KP509_20G034100 [Ceratopteris richardii]